MPLVVHYLTPPHDPAVVDVLRAELDADIELTLGTELPYPPRYDVLVGGRPTREQLAASGSLRMLVVPYAGLPEPTRELLADFPQVAAHNLHHNAASTAEMAIALLLATARRLVPADRALRANDWSWRFSTVGAAVLNGRHALVLGYGAIGQRVARVCSALGMTVNAIRRNPDPAADPAPARAVHGLDALSDLLAQTDALIICLPGTPATTGLIGERELGRMKPSALLVNIGRAPIVQERPLYEALRDGRLGGAGLDVWYCYPDRDQPDARLDTPPSAYAFGELDNVVLSPHRAGWSPETEYDRVRHLARLLNTASRGEPVPHRLDLTAGY